jgi:hypothetical protein
MYICLHIEDIGVIIVEMPARGVFRCCVPYALAAVRALNLGQFVV